MIFSHRLIFVLSLTISLTTSFQANTSTSYLQRASLSTAPELLEDKRPIPFLFSKSSVALSAEKPKKEKPKKVRPKSSGSGIPTKFDYLSSFDPEEEGLLQGEGIFEDRIKGGANYVHDVSKSWR